MRLPEIWAKCETCDPECAGHPPEDVTWSPKRAQWLCGDCFFDDGVYDEEKDEYVNETPLVFAADALLSEVEQNALLVSAMTRRRIGVTG